MSLSRGYENDDVASEVNDPDKVGMLGCGTVT